MASKKKTAKKKAKKKVSKKKTSTRARRAKATPKKGRISKATRASVRRVSGVDRSAEYKGLFEKMLAMNPKKPNEVLKVYPPEGMEAKKYQDRINSAMHALDFKRPKGCTYYKQICIDDKGRQYLAIRITGERNGS